MADQGSKALYGKAGNLSLTEQDAFMQYGAEGVKAIQPTSVNSTSGNMKDAYGQVKSLLGGSSEGAGYQPYVPKAIKSQAVSNAGNANGQGSAGFSLLGGVQGLEESLRNSQRLMFG
jgi:hypothetical protein